jgi:hypothetical protein
MLQYDETAIHVFYLATFAAPPRLDSKGPFDNRTVHKMALLYVVGALLSRGLPVILPERRNAALKHYKPSLLCSSDLHLTAP